jgi:N-acetylglutamate synthase-like GNAT family acetyltransferase
MEWQDAEFTISTDHNKLDLEVIHHFLSVESYWSKGIKREIVEAAIQNSLCFGLYHHNKQIGFARMITDYATFAYLADVFVLESYRGRGLSKWLMTCIMEHPKLQGLRRFMLATQDAHGLYAQFGYEPLPNPERFMQIFRPYQTS